MPGQQQTLKLQSERKYNKTITQLSTSVTVTKYNDLIIYMYNDKERGWRSGESTRLPPMWPGFESQTRRRMWVEFVVGSRPYSKGFLSGTLVFLPPQKINSNSIGDPRTTGLSVARLFSDHVPSLNKVDLFNS